MWLIVSVEELFATPRSTLAIELFRVLFGLACLLKFAVETRRGYFEQFKPHTFLYFAHRMRAPRFKVTERLYKTVYVAKLVAAPCVVAGVMVRPALAVLALSFAVEVATYFKFHTNLMLLVACALVLAPASTLTLQNVLALGLWQTLEETGAQRAVPFAQGLIVVTMSIVYVATAVRKVNEQFLDGAVVAVTLRTTVRGRPGRKHFDGFYPAALSRWLEGDRATLRSRLRPWMHAVVVAELLLPSALLGPRRSSGGPRSAGSSCTWRSPSSSPRRSPTSRS